VCFSFNYVLLLLARSLSESNHLRGSIQRPVMTEHGIQCNPGIDGRVEQQNIEFPVFGVFFV
jgi:hypothetical protein